MSGMEPTQFPPSIVDPLHIARFWSKVEVGRPGRECARRWQRDYRARIAATRGLKQVLGGES